MCVSPAESGLYYLQSRYYDPALGRFINADSFASTGQSILGCNMFAYCNNGPVISKDSGGSIPMCCVVVEDGSGGAGDVDDILDTTKELDELMKKNSEELTNHYLYAVKRAEMRCSYGSEKSQMLSVESVAFFDTLGFFIEKVRTGGDWDLKNNTYPSRDQFKYNGMLYSGEDIGNIHFGYVGAALYTSGFLHFGAGVYQIISGSKWEYWSTLFDEPRDSEMIEYGIKLYEGR